MSGHRHGRIRETCKSVKILGQLVGAGGDARQFQMAVGHGPAMPGNMLDHACHAAISEPFQGRTGNVCDLFRLGAKGPVTNHVMGARHRQVDHWRTIGMDRHGGQFGRDQAVTQPCRFETTFAI